MVDVSGDINNSENINISTNQQIPHLDVKNRDEEQNKIETNPLPGPKGDKGDTGDSGVRLQEDEPEDPQVYVWIKPNGELTDILKVKNAPGQWINIPAIKGEKGDGIPDGGEVGQIIAKTNDSTEWTNVGELTDETLTTDDKTIVGAINEINAKPGMPELDNITIETNTDNALQAISLVGLTSSIQELNYTDGVTNNIQTQLDGKADDNAVVHKTGDTMTGNLNMGLNPITKAGAIELGSPYPDWVTGGIIDFHWDNSTADYTSRIYEVGQGNIRFDCSKVSGSAIAGVCMPSLTSGIDMVIGASGTSYTAPANGYIWLCGDCGMGTSYMAIRQALWIDQRVYELNYASVYMTAPVKKGTYYIDYANMAFRNFRFIYADGED